MNTDRLRELLTYCPSTGEVKNTRTNRVLQADHDGLIALFDNQTKRTHKMKLERVAYALAFGVQPKDDKKVLHKNLNSSDNRLINLCLVNRAVFLMIKEAHKNLTVSIRISQHSTDQFNYVVNWMEKGVEKSKVVCDIIEARKIALNLQLKYSKILTKYCVFD